MIAFIRELERSEDGDDDAWDDWDIPAVPGGRSGPIANTVPDGFDYSLTREIGTLRSLLTRIETGIDAEADPERLVLPLTRLVESIARTIRIHNGVTGGPEDELQAAVDRVFLERGWNE